MIKPANSTFVKHISNSKSYYYQLRNRLLKAILPKRFYSDSCLITSAIPHWQFSIPFKSTRDIAARRVQHTYPDEWKLRVALWAADQALSKGDFVECGVHRGYISSAVLTHTYGVKPNKFYLCDCWDIGLYDSSYEQVKEVFNPWVEHVQLIRGYLPDSAKEIPSTKISYLYLDMNDGQVELDTLDYLWPSLIKGAIIILDDYSYPGFQDSMKPWIKSNYNILPLPTGQGLIVKS